MSKRMLYVSLLCVCFCAGGSVNGAWYRGNVHVHTDRSDGKSPANDVIEWYRSHGYDFLVVTDHNLQIVTDQMRSEFDVSGEFLLLPGEEVTDGIGGRPVHLNALGAPNVIEPQGGDSVAAVIRRNLGAIEAAGGIAVLNHPNGLLSAALTAEEIRNGGISHFEVCCADFLGGSGHPSTDQLWDSVLTGGDVIYGIAADDAHDFGSDSRDPGSAWIMVRAEELTQDSILSSIRGGDFYSTTGVLLEDVQVTERGLCLRIAEYEDYGFRTEFIGSGGSVLSIDESRDPCFEVEEATGYLRARLIRSDGALAWIQPVMLEGSED